MSITGTTFLSPNPLGSAKPTKNWGEMELEGTWKRVLDGARGFGAYLKGELLEVSGSCH